ncbi:mucin-4-like [Argiope bruennichi]|uniref:mucin-4-like n=1 Tax=Argiope bruennichi TaxID=94029 RepID=UPI002494116E|nr:mucin-4-like [Argiope bruennichi]
MRHYFLIVALGEIFYGVVSGQYIYNVDPDPGGRIFPEQDGNQNTPGEHFTSSNITPQRSKKSPDRSSSHNSFNDSDPNKIINSQQSSDLAYDSGTVEINEYPISKNEHVSQNISHKNSGIKIAGRTENHQMQIFSQQQSSLQIHDKKENSSLLEKQPPIQHLNSNELLKSLENPFNTNVDESNAQENPKSSKETSDDESFSDPEGSKVLKRKRRDIPPRRKIPRRNFKPIRNKNNISKRRKTNRNNKRGTNLQGNDHSMDYTTDHSLNAENLLPKSATIESETNRKEKQKEEIAATNSPDVLADFASSKLPPDFWNSFLSDYEPGKNNQDTPLEEKEPGNSQDDSLDIGNLDPSMTLPDDSSGITFPEHFFDDFIPDRNSPAPDGNAATTESLEVSNSDPSQQKDDVNSSENTSSDNSNAAMAESPQRRNPGPPRRTINRRKNLISRNSRKGGISTHNSPIQEEGYLTTYDDDEGSRTTIQDMAVTDDPQFEPSFPDDYPGMKFPSDFVDDILSGLDQVTSAEKLQLTTEESQLENMDIQNQDNSETEMSINPPTIDPQFSPGIPDEYPNQQFPEGFVSDMLAGLDTKTPTESVPKDGPWPRRPPFQGFGSALGRKHPRNRIQNFRNDRRNSKNRKAKPNTFSKFDNDAIFSDDQNQNEKTMQQIFPNTNEGETITQTNQASAQISSSSNEDFIQQQDDSSQTFLPASKNGRRQNFRRPINYFQPYRKREKSFNRQMPRPVNDNLLHPKQENYLSQNSPIQKSFQTASENSDYNFPYNTMSDYLRTLDSSTESAEESPISQTPEKVKNGPVNNNEMNSFDTRFNSFNPIVNNDHTSETPQSVSSKYSSEQEISILKLKNNLRNRQRNVKHRTHPSRDHDLNKHLSSQQGSLDLDTNGEDDIPSVENYSPSRSHGLNKQLTSQQESLDLDTNREYDIPSDENYGSYYTTLSQADNEPSSMDSFTESIEESVTSQTEEKVKNGPIDSNERNSFDTWFNSFKRIANSDHASKTPQSVSSKYSTEQQTSVLKRKNNLRNRQRNIKHGTHPSRNHDLNKQLTSQQEYLDLDTSEEDDNPSAENYRSYYTTLSQADNEPSFVEQYPQQNVLHIQTTDSSISVESEEFVASQMSEISTNQPGDESEISNKQKASSQTENGNSWLSLFDNWLNSFKSLINKNRTSKTPQSISPEHSTEQQTSILKLKNDLPHRQRNSKHRPHFRKNKSKQLIPQQEFSNLDTNEEDTFPSVEGTDFIQQEQRSTTMAEDYEVGYTTIGQVEEEISTFTETSSKKNYYGRRRRPHTFKRRQKHPFGSDETAHETGSSASVGYDDYDFTPIQETESSFSVPTDSSSEQNFLENQSQSQWITEFSNFGGDLGEKLILSSTDSDTNDDNSQQDFSKQQEADQNNNSLTDILYNSPTEFLIDSKEANQFRSDELYSKNAANPTNKTSNEEMSARGQANTTNDSSETFFTEDNENWQKEYHRRINHRRYHPKKSANLERTGNFPWDYVTIPDDFFEDFLDSLKNNSNNEELNTDTTNYDIIFQDDDRPDNFPMNDPTIPDDFFNDFLSGLTDTSTDSKTTTETLSSDSTSETWPSNYNIVDNYQENILTDNTRAADHEETGLGSSSETGEIEKESATTITGTFTSSITSLLETTTQTPSNPSASHPTKTNSFPIIATESLTEITEIPTTVTESSTTTAKALSTTIESPTTIYPTTMEIPTTTNEIFTTTTKILATSAEILTTTTAIPTSTITQTSTTTIEILTPTPALPTTATEIPTTATEIPTTATEIPTIATEKPTTVTDIPITSTEVPITTTEIPTTTSALPTTTAELSITTAALSTTTTEIPTTTAALPTTTTEIPTTTAALPTTTTEIPTTIAALPTIITEIPTTATENPTTIIEIPTTTTEVPITNTAIPTTTTTQIPTATSEIPTTTAAILTTTTEISTTVTEIPAITTEIPTTVTEIPVTTIKIPITATEIPATTTEIPTTVIEIPVTTIEIPITATEIPTTTTETPTTVTEIPVTTIEIPITATEIPATTTEIPATTTEIPATTTEIPTTVTEIPDTTPEIPTTSTEVLTTTRAISTTTSTQTPTATTAAAMPTTTAEVPITTVEIPTTTIQIPTTSTEISTTTAVPTTIETSSATTEISTTTTEIPTTTTENTIATAIPTTTKIPTTATEVPSTTTTIITTTTQNPTTTSEILITTTAIPTATAGISTIFNEIPTTTTKNPIKPTEFPTTTVEIPIAPKDISAKSTEFPIMTTENPTVTTKIPITTTTVSQTATVSKISTETTTEAPSTTNIETSFSTRTEIPSVTKSVVDKELPKFSSTAENAELTSVNTDKNFPISTETSKSNSEETENKTEISEVSTSSPLMSLIEASTESSTVSTVTNITSNQSNDNTEENVTTNLAVSSLSTSENTSEENAYSVDELTSEESLDNYPTDSGAATEGFYTSPLNNYTTIEPPPGVNCNENESYYACVPMCQHTCFNYDSDTPCPNFCLPGCGCKKGLLIDEKSRCVAPGDCFELTCGLDEEWYDCKPKCHNTCPNFARAEACVDHPDDCEPGCYCRDGLIMDVDGKCVDPEDCQEPVCQDEEEETDCMDQCNTCEMICHTCKMTMCRQGCDCKDGYKRDLNGTCVHVSECPPCPLPE